MTHYITITFKVPDYIDPRHGQKRMDQEQAIEKIRKRLEKQPYSWTLDEYHFEPPRCGHLSTGCC